MRLTASDYRNAIIRIANGVKSCKMCDADFDAAGGEGYKDKYCSSECAAKDGDPKARAIHPEIKEPKY